MENKKWYQSKTIWGVLIAFIGYLVTTKLNVPDLNIPANADFDSLHQLVDQVKESQGSISNIAGQIMGIIGTIIAIYGRIKSETKIA